jgi:enamine deaminase RidA (YjgF/YER057c/UK114 family)
MTVEAKLAELGIELPQVAAPVAAYVPAVLVDGFVYTAGQVPKVGDGLKYTGKLGAEVTLEEGYEAARICCLNCLAAVKSVSGSLDAVERIVKVTGFVASDPAFTDQPKVVNGASELLKEIFGQAGEHARSAVGMSALPLNAPVEVEMIVKLK